jgi:hypothetical protein
MKSAAKENYRFSSIVLGIVKSTPFQKQRWSAPAADSLQGLPESAGKVAPRR